MVGVQGTMASVEESRSCEQKHNCGEQVRHDAAANAVPRSSCCSSSRAFYLVDGFVVGIPHDQTSVRQAVPPNGWTLPFVLLVAPELRDTNHRIRTL